MQAPSLPPPLWWTQASWVGLLLAAGLALELGGAWVQLVLPGLALSVFYLGVAHSWRLSLVAGLLAGTVLEVWLDRLPVSWLLLPLVVWTSQLYRRRGDRDNLITLTLPGGLLGLGYGAGLLALNNLQGGDFLLSIGRAVTLGFTALILGALGLPLWVWLADELAGMAELPRFQHGGVRGPR